VQANARSRLKTLILGWKLTYDELARKDGVPPDEIRALANRVGSRRDDRTRGSKGEEEKEEEEEEGSGTSEGVASIVRLLAEPHCSLEHLNLCRTFLTPGDLAAMAEAVKHNSSLRQLHLFPQQADSPTGEEEKSIADRVRELLDSRGARARRQNQSEPDVPFVQLTTMTMTTTTTTTADGVEGGQPASKVRPVLEVSELRRRKKEITDELQQIEEEMKTGADEEKSEEGLAKRKRELQEELEGLAAAMRQAKSLAETARKVLRKQKKKQRKNEKRSGDSITRNGDLIPPE
jgi:hypothetical protein